MRTEKEELEHRRLMQAWCEATKNEIRLRRQDRESNPTFALLDIARSAVAHVCTIVRAAVEGVEDLPGYDELSNDLDRDLNDVFMRHLKASCALRNN